MSTPRSYTEILKRIREAQGLDKSAETAGDAGAAADTEAVNMKNESEKGKTTPPDHPEGDSAEATKTPKKPENDTGDGDDRVPGEDLEVSGTGKDIPSNPADGDAKDDAATSPTTPIDKIAGIMDKIRSLRQEDDAEKEASEKEAEESCDSEDKAKKKAKKEDMDYEEEDDKEKEAGEIEFTPELHMKLAAELTKTEEGLALAERVLQKSAGEEAARQLIASVKDERLLLEKYAAEQVQKQAQYEEYVKQANEQAQQVQQQFAELIKGASEEDLADIEKFQKTHEKVASVYEDELEKAAYSAGAMDAAAMEDAMAEGEEVPEEAPAASLEEILMLLDQAVQSGEIDEETAMAIAEQLMAEEGGGAEPMPEEAVAAEEMAAGLV